jgi:hypothetical protein
MESMEVTVKQARALVRCASRIYASVEWIPGCIRITKRNAMEGLHYLDIPDARIHVRRAGAALTIFGAVE